jgi:6-pyruvoyltetrahydropterin/6-carboxytetrahydropterin synthase
MRVTRLYRFAASHRLHAASLSETENVELYGKCNNPFGHGHNYVLHVTVAGEVDNRTGRVVDIGTLDRYVQERLLDALDHCDMNNDLADFQSVVPTTENLAVAIERRLRDGWNGMFGQASLHRLVIEETPRNTFELRTA